MPPYRRGFFQFAFIQDFGSSKLSIDTASRKEIHSALYFVSPNRILSWVRDKKMKGYLIHVNSSFFGLSDQELEDKFSFFAPSANHILEINEKEALSTLQSSLNELLSIQNDNNISYKEELLYHLLMAFLYKSEQLFSKTFGDSKKKVENISTKFNRLVEQYYLGLKSLDEYAQLLNISGNYLSQVVKQETGQTPKDIINKRVLLESQNMLIHTDFTIKEIAFHLGFKESTHFSRFLKQIALESPLSYRKRHTT